MKNNFIGFFRNTILTYFYNYENYNKVFNTSKDAFYVAESYNSIIYDPIKKLLRSNKDSIAFSVYDEDAEDIEEK